MGEASLRPFLKMQNLFCRDINRDAAPSVVKAALERICPNGKVVLPLDHGNQSAHIGQAYLNFNSVDEARRALDKHRFSLNFKGQPAKLMFAAIDKDRVYGPYSLKFQIIVKNLSEEVDVHMLFEFFSDFGEIYQCKTDIDMFGQYFGQVTYMDEQSVAQAVESANQTRWQSTVIVVEPHHKAHLAKHVGPVTPPDSSNAQDFPSLGSSSTGGGATTQQGQAQALRQQQHEEQSLFSAPVNFAVQASSSSSAAMPPPFSAAMAPPPPARPAAAADSNSALSTLDVPVPVPVPHGVAAAASALGGMELHSVAGGAPAGTLSNSSSNVNGLDGGQAVLNMFNTSFAQRNAIQATAATAGFPAGSSAADARQPVSRLGMPGSLLHLLDRRRAESAVVAAQPSSTDGLSPVGDAPVSRISFGGSHLGSSAAVGTPPGRGSSTRKGGVLRAVVAALEQVSDALCCPITHEVFRDPVVAADGVTYERAAILDWLSKSNTSPMTNTVLPNLHLHPNKLVKQLIEDLL